MPTRQRYHLHICLMRNENPALENALQVALAKDYFLTWDLIDALDEPNGFSRQQIDSCDYVLLIIGDSYGVLNASGVSTLHLNYIYAATKRQPMVTLIKLGTQQVFSRQRNDLASLITKESTQQSQTQLVTYYQTVSEAIPHCQTALTSLRAAHLKPAWCRNLGAEASLNQRFNAYSKHPKGNIESTLLMPNEFLAASKPYLPELAEVEAESVVVDYSAHAFQAGNLHTIMGSHSLTWTEIINVLKTLVPPFSTDMMHKRLNDSLRDVAMAEAIKNLENVHAVSRCQISNKDMQWIKEQMIAKNWLLDASGIHDLRERWQLHPNLP